MERFYIIYPLLAIIQQIILSAATIIAGKSINKLSFNIMKETTSEASFLLLIPHIMCLLEPDIATTISISLLIAQNCYLHSKHIYLKDFRAFQFILNNIRLTEPFFVFIISSLVDIGMFFFYTKNENEKKKSRLTIPLTFNMYISLMLAFLLRKDIDLIMIYTFFRIVCISSVFAISGTNMFFKMVVMCVLSMCFMGLFYLVNTFYFLGKIENVRF